ncbi:MAG: hypothetical protein RI995_1562 [Bacteroidota bacterium]
MFNRLLNFSPFVKMNPKQIKVFGRFQEDSVKIGQKFHYSLWVKHSGKNELFFPATNTSIPPFEITQKDYFKTKKLTNGEYVDSAVYHLQLFQPESPRILSLPIYAANDIDCTAIYPAKDIIYVKNLVKSPEKIDLNDLYQQIPFEPIQPKKDIKTFLFDILILLIIVGIINWLFGKRLRMAFELFISWRKNRDFKRAYQRLQRNINNSESGLRNLEKAIVLWKNYLENISGLPFSTSTSKEIIDLLPEKRLEKALNEMDSAIYGGNFSKNTLQSVENLLVIAASMYKRQHKKIRINFRK